MEIIVCSITGYCHGVKKTLENASLCISEAKRKNLPCYSVGNLIHNEYVVEQYCKKGLEIIEKPSDAAPGVALIRAHGISDRLKSEFIDAGFELIDSTCVNIQASVSAMKKAFSEKRKIVVIGIHGHSETEALVGVEVDGKKIADFELNEKSQIPELKKAVPSDCKVSVVVQTTFDLDKYNEMINELTTVYSDLREEKTFCKECLKRKELAEKLAENCDVIVVVGSRNSANSRELARWIEKNGTKVYFVSNPEQLDKETLEKIRANAKVGLCSGTSTPPELIDCIIKALAPST